MGVFPNCSPSLLGYKVSLLGLKLAYVGESTVLATPEILLFYSLGLELQTCHCALLFYVGALD